MNHDRVDFLVESRLIVEVKAVVALEPTHVAQVLSYLKTTRLRLGLPVNFHERTPIHGIRRVALCRGAVRSPTSVPSIRRP